MNTRNALFGMLTALALLPLSLAGEAAEPSAAGAGSAIKRTVLRRVDVPNSAYEVVVVLVEAPANASAGKHTHPGTVVGYVLEGTYTMLIEGRAPLALKPGDSLEVPAGAVHDERAGNAPAKLLAVFTVEKGKPLATPVAN
jgi:quercetin dioxygenase-like cupin family protein